MGILDLLFGARSRRSEKRREERQVGWQERPSGELSISPFAVIEGKVVAAFSKVKQDITLLSSWVKFLKHKDLLNEQRHTKTQRELGEHKTLIAGLKADASELKAAIQGLREELKAGLKEAKTSSFPDLIRTKSELNPDRKRTYFENKVVTAIRSRRKDYILKQILEIAAKETHSTREIEEIIVGEKALCGRTAFYDYFRELKHKRMIRHSEKGSKKVILAEKNSLEEVR
ncbi:hypothetical protein HYU16_00410 [Candidatus Woesearchaeota archaeon]|nr:hypothetical protein [Candidatus Woesearchaeota archaeon]